MSNVYPRFVMFKDVEAKWAKLSGAVAPTNAFGSQVWELTILTTDEAKAQEMRDAGFKVKEGSEEGKTTYAMSLKRKGTKSDGAGGTIPNSPVKIVDSNLAPMSNDVRIGNGSKVNVNIWQFEYEFAGKKGISSALTGVQVVDLVEFKPSGGFEVIPAASSEGAVVSNEEPTTMPF